MFRARTRQEAEARAAQADAARRDRNLLQRYKTEATHQKARETALEPVRAAGVTRFLPKPIVRSEVRRLVSEVGGP